MIVNIKNWGNSQGIRIPKHILKDLGWSMNEAVKITTADGKIIIERARFQLRKNLKELFEEFEGNYKPEELCWGEPSGRELW